jgi:hypothetical protein
MNKEKLSKKAQNPPLRKGDVISSVKEISYDDIEKLFRIFA